MAKKIDKHFTDDDNEFREGNSFPFIVSKTA